MANKELKSIKFPGLVDTYTVNSVPDGASANQQLVTDKDGVVKWEEKPFFHAEYGDDITWDGDTTDREIFEMVPFSFYKVSDTIYTRDRMVGRHYTVMNNGTEVEAVVTDTTIVAPYPECPDLYFILFFDAAAFCFGPAYESLGFPGGVFFLNHNGSLYTNYLSGNIVKRIDPLYFPEIPAEKLPEIPAEKLPSSFFSMVQKTFEGSFDKVTDGRDTFVFNSFSYYKISEFSPRREDVISFSGTRDDGFVYSDITEGENCCKYGLFIIVYQAGKCRLAVNSTTSYSFNAPSAGLYATNRSSAYNFTYKSISNMIQSSTTLKRYYLDVDDSGTLIVAEVSK